MNRFLDRLTSYHFWNKLVSQFIFSHVALASFSILFVGSILISTMNSYIQPSVTDSLLQKAKNSATQINHFVNSKLDLLSAIARQPQFFSEELNRQQIIDKLKVDNNYYKSISVVDTSMMIISSTDIINQNNNRYPFIEFYYNAVEADRHISPVYIENDRPYIRVASNISVFENFVGLLIAEIDMKFIWTLMDTLSNDIQDGYTFLISSDGAVIAHKDLNVIFNQENYGGLAFIQKLIAGDEGTELFNDPFTENRSMICAYTPVKDLSWGMVVTQAEETAYEVSRRLSRDFVIMIISGTLLASFIGIILTRNMSQPLRFLVAGVKKVSEGSLLETIQVPRTEELATLAIEFNNMTTNLRQMQNKLKHAERLATVSKFASVVAHEIRNPFNSIVINMQVLKRKMKRGEKRDSLEDMMDIIDMEIRRIDGLIQNYLSITRPNPIQKHQVDLSVLLDEVILSQHERAASQSITFKRDFTSESVVINADGDQVKQAVLNIFINAFQAMKDGGKIDISVKTDHKNSRYKGFVELSFRDYGVGIEPEIIPEVFDFFFTSKRSGTGLGLAVTKQIINAHNGEIFITSEPEHGTVVKIYLPVN